MTKKKMKDEGEACLFYIDKLCDLIKEKLSFEDSIHCAVRTS